MRATNLRNGRELSNNVVVADTIFKRMKGLLGKKNMRAGESLWIKPCMSIHTVGMRFSIDVIFLNKKNEVIAIKKNLKPNRMTRLYPKAVSVLEMPSGMLDVTATEIGDKIEIA